MKAVEAAKKDIDPAQLKNDPTKNMERPPVGFDRRVLREDMIQAEGDSDDEDLDEEDIDDEDGVLFDSDDDDDDGFEEYRVADWL